MPRSRWREGRKDFQKVIDGRRQLEDGAGLAAKVILGILSRVALVPWVSGAGHPVPEEVLGIAVGKDAALLLPVVGESTGGVSLEVRRGDEGVGGGKDARGPTESLETVGSHHVPGKVTLTVTRT